MSGFARVSLATALWALVWSLGCAGLGAGGTAAPKPPVAVPGGVVQFGTERDDTAWEIAAWDDALYAVGSTDHVFDKVCDLDTRDEQAFVRQFDAETLKPGWVDAFGTPASDTVRAIDADRSGLVVVGTTGGALDGAFAGGKTDVFVRKYGHDGTLIGRRQLGTGKMDEGLGIFVFGGFVWVVGGTTGDMCTSLLGKRHAPCAHGAEDAFVAKLDPDLEVVDVVHIGSDRFEEATGLTVDERWVTVVGATGGLVGERDLGKGDAWVVRLTHDLDLRDAHQFGTARSDFARGVVTWKGDTFVVGRAEGALAPGSADRSKTDNDAYLYRVPFDGKKAWVVQWEDASGESASRIANDPSGLYVVGSGGLGHVKHGCDPVDQRGDLRKFDYDGKLLWRSTIDSAGGVEDEAMGLALSRFGVFVAGKTLGVLGERSLGAYDGWIRRADAETGVPR